MEIIDKIKSELGVNVNMHYDGIYVISDKSFKEQDVFHSQKVESLKDQRKEIAKRYESLRQVYVENNKLLEKRNEKIGDLKDENKRLIKLVMILKNSKR